MATSIHLPPDLLARIDSRANSEKISRNRFISRALERALDVKDRWSPEFLDALDEMAPSTGLTRTADEMIDVITSARSSKQTPPL